MMTGNLIFLSLKQHMGGIDMNHIDLNRKAIHYMSLFIWQNVKNWELVEHLNQDAVRERQALLKWQAWNNRS